MLTHTYISKSEAAQKQTFERKNKNKQSKQDLKYVSIV